MVLIGVYTDLVTNTEVHRLPAYSGHGNQKAENMEMELFFRPSIFSVFKKLMDVLVF